MSYEKSFEEYQSWKASQESLPKRIIKNFEVKHIILIILLAVFLVILLQTQKDNKKTVLIMGGGLFALIIFLTLRTTTMRRLILEDKVKIIIVQALKEKIGHEDWIPNGTQIFLTGYCALRKWGDDYYKWEVGVKLILPDGLIDERMIAVHPYEGIIVKIEATPTGYDATKTPDIKPIYAMEIPQEEFSAE